MLDKTYEGYEERLKEGKLLLFTRGSTFYARVYKGERTRSYLIRSLKTKDLAEARKAAERFFYEIEIKREENLPLQSKRFSDVIAEYLKLRRNQHERGTYKQANKRHQQQTSAANLRQMERVSKFWIEYCGNVGVDRIDNALLSDYVAWRRDYYQRIPEAKRPRNYSLHPADKTLEWETIFALTLIKYAHERSYRGAKALPYFYHRASRAKTRPSFSRQEYRQLYVAMRRWIKATDNEKRRYPRELLRDYVLILANSGIRIGEANNLRERDLTKFTDEIGRENYKFTVDGKTGKREVILRTNAVRYIDRCLERNAKWKASWGKSASAATKTHNRKSAAHSDWLFRMGDGNKIITLGDQFSKVLTLGDIVESVDGEAFSLYSLRHFYAVQMLRHGKANVYDIAKNMGTSVDMIERYYGRSATAAVVASCLLVLAADVLLVGLIQAVN